MMGEKEYGKGQQYGNFKIVWHPEKLKSLREKKITPPIYVRLKPTDLCDHQCFYCFYDSDILNRHFRNREQIPREKIMEILADFS